MQFTIAAVVAIFAASTSAQAIRSQPFNLFVTSANKKYNNTALQACHTGAGLESLCVNYGSGVFHFNRTSAPSSISPNGDISGYLTYDLPASPQPVEQSLGFFLPPNTNVAQAIFGEPVVYLAFDKNSRLNIPTSYNDKVTPPTISGNFTAYYRWHICQTNFLGYTYETLNWVYGVGPHNPSCVLVDVKRVFIS